MLYLYPSKCTQKSPVQIGGDWTGLPPLTEPEANKPKNLGKEKEDATG
jgi:hypothetical protein